MTHKTVLSIFSELSQSDSQSIIKQVETSSSQVTAGRYLISVFNAPSNWESRIPIEALVVSGTLGNIENRNPNWEYFGNGAIRCYKGKSLKLSKTLQWNIIKKLGDKPLTTIEQMIDIIKQIDDHKAKQNALKELNAMVNSNINIA
jgi:hypothetical protein